MNIDQLALMADRIDTFLLRAWSFYFWKLSLGEFLELEVSIYLEDRANVVKRTLESNRLAYQGPIMKISSPVKGQELRFAVSLSQIMNTEKDQKGRFQTILSIQCVQSQ